MLGAFAELVVAPEFMCFKLPDELDFAQGAALVLNYHTAYFSLKLRGRLAEGETVLVHGAAGGVGTASLQVAKGLGARTIGVVSSDEKEQVAREAGADEVVSLGWPWKDQAKELSGGGVDVVLDPVGRRAIHRQHPLAAGGRRVVVVGFTEGSIPEVKVNRLLLGNTEVIGAGWGAYVMCKPEVTQADRRRDHAADRSGLRSADRRRALPDGAGRRRAQADRRARRDRQGRAGHRLSRRLALGQRDPGGFSSRICGVGSPRSIRRRSVAATPSNERVFQPRASGARRRTAGRPDGPGGGA